MSTFALGKYRVVIGLRKDNPAFPSFIIYRGTKFIGRSFSRPDESACRWLELQQRYDRPVYATAEQSAKPKAHTPRGGAKARAISRLHRLTTVALELDTEPA